MYATAVTPSTVLRQASVRIGVASTQSPTTRWTRGTAWSHCAARTWPGLPVAERPLLRRQRLLALDQLNLPGDVTKGSLGQVVPPPARPPTGRPTRIATCTRARCQGSVRAPPKPSQALPAPIHAVPRSQTMHACANACVGLSASTQWHVRTSRVFEKEICFCVRCAERAPSLHCIGQAREAAIECVHSPPTSDHRVPSVRVGGLGLWVTRRSVPFMLRTGSPRTHGTIAYQNNNGNWTHTSGVKR